MKSSAKLIWLLIAVVVVGAGGYWLWHKLSAPAAKAEPALAVRTVAVVQQNVPKLIEASGRVIASQSVEIRPQASGVLQSVRLADGQRVERGQLLFTVDPQPLKAAVAQARANYARDQALADDAAQSESRLKPLATEQFYSAKDYQTAVNTLHSLRASAAASKALVDEAVIALGYAEVHAPIAGRAGAILVKPGNLVSPTSSTPLMVINVASPADISFALPQSQAAALREAQRGGGSASLPVIALDPASRVEQARGALFFVDNAFDDSSGTLELRARFGNAEEALWPGQFETVRIILGDDPNALTIPETALQQGQDGPFVYRVDAGKAHVQKLKVARVLDGRVVVSEGLHQGDQVVLAVPNNLRDGMAVQASNAADKATASGSGAATAVGSTPQ